MRGTLREALRQTRAAQVSGIDAVVAEMCDMIPEGRNALRPDEVRDLARRAGQKVKDSLNDPKEELGPGSTLPSYVSRRPD